MANKQNINIGIQSNDGTGDSIRDAFRKTNENFDALFDALVSPQGFRFFGTLEDTPQSALPKKMLVTDALGQRVTQVALTSGTGISIDFNYGSSEWVINNSASSLLTDPNPTLGADLIGSSGTSSWRAKEFANPIADQDLVTRKFLYDNFLNRDGVTKYGNELNTTTNIAGSVFRENVSIIPNGIFTATVTNNSGKYITVRNANGSTSTIDLTLQATESSHITRKDYVDSKISLQGVDTIDPATGEINSGFGKMTGPLILSRNPVTQDDYDFNGFIAATKQYVDKNDFYSDNNLFITKKGRDYQPDIPPDRRGRSPAYAFASLNKAAQYAEKLQAAAQIEVGDYARLITHTNGISATVIDSTKNQYGNNISRLRLSVGSYGSDQFGAAAIGKFTIFPGQYVQGVSSGAIALIENIEKGTNSGDPEIYKISYVDYGDDFNTSIKTSTPDFSKPNQIKMSFASEPQQIAPVPKFWVGYKFYTDTGIPNGTILSVGYDVDNNGIYHNYFIVEFESLKPGNDITFTEKQWHVYSGDFSPGETIVYNTNVSALQITFVIESGEYFEQYPIKLSANTSIRGDEFRRVIIRPAPGVSSSKWANIYFRRDAQVDGLQTTELDYSTDYAHGGTLNNSNAQPSGLSGLISVSINTGKVPSEIKGYMFVGNGGQGIIETVALDGSGFTVNVGTTLTSSSPIPYGSWHVYKPITFGYHYLRNPKKPMNLLVTENNPGGLENAATLLKLNRNFIKSEVIQYLDNNYVIGQTFTYNTSTCSRDVGLFVDSFAHDLIYGGSERSIYAGDIYKNIPLVQTSESTQTAAAVTYLGSIAQQIILNTTVTSLTSAEQIFDISLVAEPTAGIILADLVQATTRIISNDLDFNPPKENNELDVFLMNDANVIRYVSCQNHGGFMQVLDPEGQIKNKSPYTQTASSFSQSISKHAFRGGMLVDGFSGNVQATTNNWNITNPLELDITGLLRRPQVPTFFTNNGIRYEVDFFTNFTQDGVNENNVPLYSATLNLNPLSPGGILNEILSEDRASNGNFKANLTNIPITLDQPQGIGGIPATGHAISDGTGHITGIVIDFPGIGYTTTPNISVGGAFLNNLNIVDGKITSASIVYGGLGYTNITLIKIIAIGAFGVETAQGQVTQVDENGSITAISITNQGANWTSNTMYRVEFGNLSITVPPPQAGFIDVPPTNIELVTAGNRSMLANDFTQVNDLGYGIFVTNGGFMENVSMFTYYCYRSYFSLNGSQVRSTTGSSAYGEWGLIADGVDPTEVPLSITTVFPMIQIATAYVANPLFPAQANQSFIYVTIDPDNGGFPPLNASTIELNHGGIRRQYSIGTASPAVNSNNEIIPNRYLLSFNSGSVSASSNGIGLLVEVNNGDPVIIRTGSLFKIKGFDPASISRPITSLTWNDDPTTVYHITDFSSVQPDGAVFGYSSEEYNYISFRSAEQGLTQPAMVLDQNGSNYTTATIVIGTATNVITNNILQTVSGTQGNGTIGIQTISLNNISNIIVGHKVSTSTYIIDNTFVTYVNTTTKQICISNPTVGEILNGTTLTFNAVYPTAHANISSGTIASITVDNGGAGWKSSSTTITISGDGINARVESPLKIAGIIGSKVVKISTLNLIDQNRIQQGLILNPQRLYQFAHGNSIYKITGYRAPIDEHSLAEIDIDKPLVEAISLGTSFNAGLPVYSYGALTTRISILRASGHDFVDIGTGGYATTRIPNDLYGPPIQQPNSSHEVLEQNRGRVFYVSTDQDGNFRVGTAFAVNQAQGSVTISAPVDLSNLTSIGLRRDLGPSINEFSIDSMMNSEADYKVPTEQAVVNYINRRLGIDRNGNIYPGSPLGPQFLSLDGQLSMKADLDMSDDINGPHRIINLKNPINSSDASTKGYTDSKLSTDGTRALDANGITIQPEWGNMNGPLQLFDDPKTKIATVANLAAQGANHIEFTVETVQTSEVQAGDFFSNQVIGQGIKTGTIVTSISSSTYGYDFILSDTLDSAISSGTPITFEPVRQAVTKGYVDFHDKYITATTLTVSGQSILHALTATDVTATTLTVSGQSILHALTATDVTATTLKVSGQSILHALTATDVTATTLKVSGQSILATLKLDSTEIALGKNAGLTSQGTNAVAIGASAGNDTQGTNAVAIGVYAGYTTQSDYAVAIGQNAGATDQGSSAVAIGQSAGLTTQSNYAVAIGQNAGLTTQGANAVAIGANAGATNQTANSIIINATGAALNSSNAGTYIAPIRADSSNAATDWAVHYNPTTSELTTATAMHLTGTANEVTVSGSTGRVTIGLPDYVTVTNLTVKNEIRGEKYSYQLANATDGGQYNAIDQGSNLAYYNAMFRNDGDNVYLLSSSSATSQLNALNAGWNYYRPFAWNLESGNVSIANNSNGVDTNVLIGGATTFSKQVTANTTLTAAILRTTDTEIALGDQAGYTSQGTSAVAIGNSAGTNSQGTSAVAIGLSAGLTSQGSSAVAIGTSAGTTSQGQQSVAIGYNAGYTTQGMQAVAIGNSAGQNTQSNYAVAIGVDAGYTSQGRSAVAIGTSAGTNSQGTSAVAIGLSAGLTSQGQQSVAIGASAGYSNQGDDAVAIGNQAGATNQTANSIIINATGAELNSSNAGTYIAPIRADSSSAATDWAVHYNPDTSELTTATAMHLSGTTNEVTVSGSTGSVTIGLPNYVSIQYLNVITKSTATDLTVNNSLRSDSSGTIVYGTWTLATGATFQATYADLAEWYSSDVEYEPGTVLVFGGSAEVTTTTELDDIRVAGPVTSHPAYVLNQGLTGTRSCIALIGRVPVKVSGFVKKGDLLTTSNTPGYAKKATFPILGSIIGKALEDKTDPGQGIIEVAVGRL